MSSSTQLTLLSARSSRSPSHHQLSSGRQSTVSSLARSKQNGLRSGRVAVEPNPLPVQQFRPFSISGSLYTSVSRAKQQPPPPPSLSSAASSAIAGDTMSHNRLKQLKQVYSSNLYLFQCLAFIGFLLLAVRLYEVNKDINYLRHVSSAWLPNITAPAGAFSTAAETLRLSSSTVSMLSEAESDKTPFASPLASASTASLEPDGEDDLDEEESEISETEVRLKSRSLKPNSEANSFESLPQPQALQFRSNRFPSRSTTNGLTRTTSSSSSSPSSSSSSGSSSASTASLSSSTNALSSGSPSSSSLSSTPNTTPLSTQVDSIQREIDLAKARSAYYHVENLRKDVDSLIVDMWSSRTTLMLSLVFMSVYIISWGWMMHAVHETKTPKDVTLKTVLLLAVFSAVDIAASAGFVMVRLILYSMKDNQFANEMRIPSASNEYQQLTAYSALRFAALRSTSGSIDIFASLIISFFIFIRIYNVISAMTFYQRVRKIYSQEKHRSIATSLNEIGERQGKDYDDLFKRISFIKDATLPPLAPSHHLPFNSGLNSSTLLNQMNPLSQMNPLNQSLLSPNLNSVNLNNALNNVFGQTAAKTFLNNNTNLAAQAASATLNRHKNFGNFGNDHRRFSTATSLLSEDEQLNSMMNNLNSNETNLNNASHLPFGDDQPLNSNTIPLKTGSSESVESQIKVQAADMPPEMRKFAIKSVKKAVQLYTTEKHVAESIKQDFDNEYGCTWHCVVGRQWSSCVSYTTGKDGTGYYIRMSYKDLTILLYKST